jgi:superfamily I DNA and/or RNA helicase
VSLKEATVVANVLGEILANGNAKCKLQILSPYNDQLAAIRDAVARTRKQGLLAQMFMDPFNIDKAKRTGRTVDQFQGSEADIVIVSLVRNNALVPWKSIGFLKEKNRMNVLLSRARHKLIIVGSWEFFRTRCSEHTSKDDEHFYIGEMMRQMQDAEDAGNLARIQKFG